MLSQVDLTKLVKQPADQIDIPQKFNVTGLYDLPFGKGKNFSLFAENAAEREKANKPPEAL